MKWLLFCWLYLLSATVLFAQDVIPAKLNMKRLNRVPEHFYISSVTDDRADTGSIGIMRIGTNRSQSHFNPEHGAAAAITAMLPAGRQRNATPVEMHITLLKISETIRGTFEEISDSAGFAFYRNNIKLVEFTGSFRMTTNMGASGHIDQLISEPVAGALEKLDKWWAEHQVQLNASPAVHVSVKMGLPDEIRLIGYSTGHPLRLADFKGTPDEESPGDAATSSGIHVNYEIHSEYGSVDVLVTVTPVFDKLESWVKKEGRNTETLQHEQVHFDITALKACRYIELVNAYRFSIDNYTAELDAIYKQVQQEWEDMENAYDNETSHGQQRQAQREWEIKIQSQLESMHCYR